MSDQEAREARAFEYAKEAVTQLLSLATAVLALSLTFSKDLAANATRSERRLLHVSWLLLLLSILGGLMTLLSMAGVVRLPQRTIKDLRVTWLVQASAFLVALVLFAWFGWQAL